LRVYREDNASTKIEALLRPSLLNILRSSTSLQTETSIVLFHEELFRKSSSERYLRRNENDDPNGGKTQNHNVFVDDDAFEGVGESEGGRLWETRIPGIAKGVADKSVSAQGMRWPATAAGVAGVFEKVYSHDRTSKNIHIENEDDNRNKDACPEGQT